MSFWNQSSFSVWRMACALHGLEHKQKKGSRLSSDAIEGHHGAIMISRVMYVCLIHRSNQMSIGLDVSTVENTHWQKLGRIKGPLKQQREKQISSWVNMLTCAKIGWFIMLSYRLLATMTEWKWNSMQFSFSTYELLCFFPPSFSSPVPFSNAFRLSLDQGYRLSHASTMDNDIILRTESRKTPKTSPMRWKNGEWLLWNSPKPVVENSGEVINETQRKKLAVFCISFSLLFSSSSSDAKRTDTAREREGKREREGAGASASMMLALRERIEPIFTRIALVHTAKQNCSTQWGKSALAIKKIY